MIIEYVKNLLLQRPLYYFIDMI